MDQLSCSFCQSKNCKLWAERPLNQFSPWRIDNHKIYCLQCLFDSRIKLFISFELLKVKGIPRFIADFYPFQPYNSTLKSAPDWIGDFPPAISADGYFIPNFRLKNQALNEWRNLPDLPEWWLHDTLHSLHRRVQIKSIFQRELHILNCNIFVDSSFDESDSTSKIYVGSEKISIPESLHTISWIRSLEKLSESVFFKLIKK
jgi:hypothetical protein